MHTSLLTSYELLWFSKPFKALSCSLREARKISGIYLEYLNAQLSNVFSRHNRLFIDATMSVEDIYNAITCVDSWKAKSVADVLGSLQTS